MISILKKVYKKKIMILITNHNITWLRKNKLEIRC